ncbi:hypothetical protein scyTo_0018992 [Scyliorhinus torazame]|uniref:Interleukin-18 n=1 Tax=Scyliorhinus torazame TaxID=75743 RepID=A0A401PQC2_SCYTO|nr:hypothetical protein [Scyliorhinus torazame]
MLLPACKQIYFYLDFAEDCLEFADQRTVLVQDRFHKLLVFANNEKHKTAEFRDINNKERTEAMRPNNLVNGIEFDIIFYESTKCTQDCKFRKFSFPVSFVVQCNSKKYQMSCSKSIGIEFQELSTPPEKETVDFRERNIIFYMKSLGQFSVFESDLVRDHCLCAEPENGLYKLALKKVTKSIDEETHLELVT